MSLTALALGLLALGASPPSGGPAGDGAQASWAIGPGHERVFKTLLPAREGELEDGWALRHLGVPGDRVEAIYGPKDTPKSCAKAPLCLALVHPSGAPGEAPRAGPFALVVRAAQGIATEALVAGITSRLSAAPAFDPFKRIEAKVAPPPAPNVGEVVGESAATDLDLGARFGTFLSSDPDLAGRLAKVDVTPSRVRYHLRGDGGDVHVVELRPRSPRQSHPDEVTTSFFVQGVGPLADPPDLTARVHRAVARGDDGSLRLAPEHVMSRGERSPLHWILIALSALALLALALGSRGLARAVRQTLGPGRLVWWLLGLGIVLRLVLPYRMVEMGIGYQLTRLADELLLPRYGAGTVTLHHGVMTLFGADHAVMVWTHKILGCLTLPLATAVGARLLGPIRTALPQAVPLWAGALALSPMLLRSDLTESNLVPVLLGLWAGLFAWQTLEGRARVILTAAGLAYAGLCRPEMAVVAPGIWLLLERPWRARREAILVGVVLAVALSAQLVFVNQVVAWEIGEQSLHFSKGLSPGRLAKILANNALFDPTIVPLLTPLLALGAVVHKEGRSLALTLMGGGLLWLYVYAVDLSNASQPRLHIVALLPWSLAAALTMARLLAHHRSTGISVLALWMLTALGTVPTLWAPTNEDTQDALFDRLEEALPKEEGAVLVTLARSDAPDEAGHYTHRHLPTYRFSEVETLPIGSMMVALERAPGKVYYFQGVSCYAQLLRAARQERGILPACARVHERFTLAPIWTDRVPNHGNPSHQELGYYGDDPAFDVGLWRVEGLSEEPAGAAAR